MNRIVEQGVAALAVPAAAFAIHGEQAMAHESKRVPPSVTELAGKAIKDTAAVVDENSILLDRKLPGQQTLRLQVDFEEITPGKKLNAKDLLSFYVSVDRAHPCKPSVPVSVLRTTYDASEQGGKWYVTREKKLEELPDPVIEHQGINIDTSQRFIKTGLDETITDMTESHKPADAQKMLMRLSAQTARLMNGHALVLPKTLKADLKEMACDDARRHTVIPHEAKPRTTTTAQLARLILAEKPKPDKAPNAVIVEKRLPEGQSATISLRFSERAKGGKYDPKKVSYINLLVKKKIGNREIGPYRQISLNKTADGTWAGHSAYTKVADEITHITEVSDDKVTSSEQVPVGDSFRNQNVRIHDSPRRASKLLGFFKNQAASMAKLIFDRKALPEPK